MERVLAINTLIYGENDLRTIAREIAQLGTNTVELAFLQAYFPTLSDEFFTDWRARQYRSVLSEFGLSSVALSAHMDLGEENSCPAFERRMVFAKELGARYIISNSSQRIREKMFFRNIAVLADLAQSLSLVICLENPGDGEDQIVFSGKTGAKVIQEIGSEWVRLNYDIGNVFIYSKGAIRPEADLDEALPAAVHYHLKDVREDPTGYYYCQIGTGVIDYKEILGTLAAKASSAPLAIELPLQLKRGLDFVSWVDSSPADLVDVRRILKGSLEFAKRWTDLKVCEKSNSINGRTGKQGV
jgi:sugar phosphate isomerase/epimerase